MNEHTSFYVLLRVYRLSLLPPARSTNFIKNVQMLTVEQKTTPLTYIRKTIVKRFLH